MQCFIDRLLQAFVLVEVDSMVNAYRQQLLNDMSANFQDRILDGLKAKHMNL